MSQADGPDVGGAAVPDDDGGELELEPVFQQAIDPTSDSQSFHFALAASPMPSITTETGDLLRRRLKSAATFLALGYTVFFIFGLFDQGSVQSMGLLTIGLRIALSLATVGLLGSQYPLTYRQLRGLEYAFFGLMVVLMMVGQYISGSELIDRGDLPRLVGLEKNGIINLLVLMTLYGVFIPNTPLNTARVVLTMALGPLFLLVALKMKASEATSIVDHVASSQFALGNMLFVVVSAALAIYTAHVLHGLRRDLHEARKLGQYQLGEKLGEGGMGEVYMAEHQLLKRPCALKLIKSDVETNPIALARFEREVRSAAMLSHPNTIEIFDYGHTDDGTFYYVMEYLPGLSLSDLVRQFGPIEPARTVYIMRQVCGALGEAHRFGLVHRDLKPANILLAIQGGKCDIAKVLDFGLVKLAASPNAPQLTADYTVSGTPQYMSPEQATASPELDGRADIYSLGAILYFMLTGRPPFEGKTPTELMIAHARDPVIPPSRYKPGIPADLEAIVIRCLAKKPSERYRDTRELSSALAACACARDWDDETADAWWIEKSTTRIVSSPAAEPADATA